MNAHSDVGIASRRLQVELKKRFKKYTDPNAVNHQPIFLVGTALDPRYRLLLNPIQMSATKTQLLKEVCAVQDISTELCGYAFAEQFVYASRH